MADSLPQQHSFHIPPPPNPSTSPYQSRTPTGLGKDPLNILILGASFAGLSCAHHFLDSTYRHLNTSTAVPAYRLVIVSPSTHIYWNIGAPRAIVGFNGGGGGGGGRKLMKESDIFREIEEGFHRHRGSGTMFVQGEATGVDFKRKVVQVELFGREGVKRASFVAGTAAGGKRGSRHYDNAAGAAAAGSGVGNKTQTIPYHALIIATGSAAHSELLSLHGTHLRTLGTLTAFHARAAAASSIVVCGAGPSGVECAGQLATFLDKSSSSSIRGGGSGIFHRRRGASSAHPGNRRIVLITGGSRCLPNLPSAVGAHAERKLRRLGVEVRHGVRVVQAREPATLDGVTTVVLDDGTSVQADVYVPCTGVEPNSGFVPARYRDGRGYVVTDEGGTLRVAAAGTATSSTAEEGGGGGEGGEVEVRGEVDKPERVYAIGDVAAYSANYVLDVYAAVPVVMHNLLNDLLAHEYHLASPYGGNEDRIAALVDEEYTKGTVESQLCPISRYGGSGVLLGWRVPSWVVHLFKGRDYRVGKVGKVVLDGGNPYAIRGRYE